MQRLNIAILRQAVLGKRIAAAAGIQLSNAEAVAAARTKLFTLAQQGLVKALKSTSLAMLTNPAMLAAAAVAGLAFGIYKLVTCQTDAEKGQRRLNDAIKESEKASFAETRELARLKGELSGATKGSDTYKSIKEKIISNYGKYHKGLADEIEKVGLLDSTYKKLTESIQSSFAARQYEQFKQAESDNLDEVMSKNLGKIQDRLIDKLGDEAGAKYYARIRDAIFNGTVSVPKVGFLETTGLDPETQAALDKVSGRENIAKFFNVVNTAIENYISNILRAQELADDLDKKARARFGIDGDAVQGGGQGAEANQFATFHEQVETARQAVAKLKQELADLRAGKTQTPDYATDIEAKAKALKEAEERLNTLLGIDKQKKEKDAPKPHDYSEQIEKEKREKIQLYQSLAYDVQQAEINVMDDQHQKKLAQIELNYEKELTQIDKQKADHLAHIQEWERTIWESENPDWKEKKKEFKPTTTKLSVEDDTQYEALFGAAEKQRAQAISDANKEAYETELRNYESFAQSYLAKVNEFNKEIEDLQAKGVKEDIITGIKNMQAETLAGLDEEMGIMEQGFVTFIEELAVMGIQDLQAKLSEVKDRLGAEEAGGGRDKQKIIALNKQILALQKAINQVVKGKDPTEVKAPDIKARWKDVSAIIQDVGATTGELIDSFEELDDSTKEILHSANNIATGTTKMIDGIVKLATGGMMATAGTAIAASAAISMVEKASIILTIITAAVQVVMAIINLFKGNHDKKKEKEIQQLQGQVDKLEASYERLEKAIKKAYSGGAAELIRMQEENLKLTRAAIEQQIKLEEEKKKTDKNAIQQYKDRIKEIDDELEGINEKIVETVIGTSIKSAIDDFAEAYMDAWAAGEDKAAAMKDVVRKMIKSTVTELVKSRLSEEVEAYMNYLSSAMEGGVLTIAEEQTLDYLEAAIYSKLGSFDANLDKYIKEHTEDEGRQASAKGVESMNQDTANELNGRFTAMQGHTYSINENTKILVANSTMILQVIMMIEVHARSLARLGDMQTDIRALKNTLGDIALKGLTVKK